MRNRLAPQADCSPASWTTECSTVRVGKGDKTSCRADVTGPTRYLYYPFFTRVVAMFVSHAFQSPKCCEVEQLPCSMDCQIQPAKATGFHAAVTLFRSC